MLIVCLFKDSNYRQGMEVTGESHKKAIGQQSQEALADYLALLCLKSSQNTSQLASVTPGSYIQ